MSIYNGLSVYGYIKFMLEHMIMFTPVYISDSEVIEFQIYSIKRDF